jgi:hypothetical protein
MTPAAAPCDVHGALSVDSLKGRLASLDVVADSIDHGLGAIHCRTHRRIVPYVGVDRGDLPSLAGFCEE